MQILFIGILVHTNTFYCSIFSFYQTIDFGHTQEEKFALSLTQNSSRKIERLKLLLIKSTVVQVYRFLSPSMQLT